MNASIGRLGMLLAVGLLPAVLSAATINGTVLGPDSTTAVANAAVVLSRAGTGGGGRTPIDTAQTDAQGKFAFADLAAAQNYGIAVTAAGFLAYANNNVDLDSGATVDLGIKLAPVPPPANLSGIVRNGTDTAALIANATVVLTQSAGGTRSPVDTATTNAQGQFSFPDLAAMDNYGLTITAAGFTPFTNNNIDLEGRDTSVTASLLPLADIAGVVRGGPDANSAPVAGATVVLTRTGTGGGARTPVDTVTTDAQGQFSFPDLAAMDNYGLTVSATGFAAYTNNNIDLEGRDTTVTVNLLPRADIAGTVVGSDSTTPVSGATVVLTQAGTGGGGNRTPLDTVTTNAQGQFSFPDLESRDNYGLVVIAAGFAIYLNNNVDLRGRDTSVKVVLLPPAAPGSIIGVVRGPGASGAFIANAPVVLRNPQAVGGQPLDTVQTNAQGQYSFPSVPAMDNYIVSVAVTGFTTATNNNVDVDSGDTTTVNFNLTTVSVLRMPSGTAWRATWAGPSLSLVFPPEPRARMLSVHNLSGATLYRRAIPADAGAALIPENVLRGEGALISVAAGDDRTTFKLPRR